MFYLLSCSFLTVSQPQHLESTTHSPTLEEPSNVTPTFTVPKQNPQLGQPLFEGKPVPLTGQLISMAISPNEKHWIVVLREQIDDVQYQIHVLSNDAVKSYEQRFIVPRVWSNISNTGQWDITIKGDEFFSIEKGIDAPKKKVAIVQHKCPKSRLSYKKYDGDCLSIDKGSIHVNGKIVLPLSENLTKIANVHIQDSNWGFCFREKGSSDWFSITNGLKYGPWDSECIMNFALANKHWIGTNPFQTDLWIDGYNITDFDGAVGYASKSEKLYFAVLKLKTIYIYNVTP